MFDVASRLLFWGGQGRNTVSLRVGFPFSRETAKLGQCFAHMSGSPTNAAIA